MKKATILFYVVGRKKTLSASKSRDEHNEARSARPANMIAEAGEGGIFARVRKRMRAFLAFLAQKTRKATTFADLPRDIKTQILGRSDVIEEADLARLRAVSRSMRDAVDATMEDLRDVRLAAKLGCLTALRNLLQRGHLDRRFVCEFTALGGHLEVLMWARANDCPWNEDTCSSAACSGNLEVLRWARENGCPWNERTCSSAAEGGHLETLMLARKNGCPWDERTCALAAEGGHLAVLMWARENGCPWNKELVCFHATSGGHLEMQEWLRSTSGSSFPASSEEARD